MNNDHHLNDYCAADRRLAQMQEETSAQIARRFWPQAVAMAVGFAAAVVVAMASPVKSDHTGVPYKPASESLVPPAQYNNQMGARYLGIFRRVLADHATIKAACTTLKNPNPLACAKFPQGRPATGPAPACTVYIPNNLPADLYKAVNTHEVGHCLGFRH